MMCPRRERSDANVKNDKTKDIDLSCQRQAIAALSRGYDAAMNQLRQKMQSGIDAHRAGKLADAERFYREVLAADANNPDAWRLLGVIASQVSKFEVAVQLIARSAQIRGDLPEVWTDLGAALLGLGKLEDAKVAYEKALAIRPDFAPA